MKLWSKWWKKRLTPEEAIAEEDLVIEREHTVWLNKLTTQEQQLYEFVIRSLETEPEKWNHINWSSRTLRSREYGLCISSDYIKKMDYGTTPTEEKILLEVPTTFHRRLIAEIYNKYLDRAKVDADTKRIESISYELERLERNRKL